MNRPVKYAAELHHVREVTLTGSADLAFWAERLKREGLSVAEQDGKARIMIIAADGKYMGVRFRELSVSVLASSDEGGERQAGAYLVQAFNSNRFFAFCERTFFSTPYVHGDVRVACPAPATIGVAIRGQTLFEARMGGNPATSARTPSRVGEAGWEGPVFLPSTGDSRRRHFFASVRGETETYPYLPGEDAVNFGATGVFGELAASEFVGVEWAVRADATHRKSTTSCARAM